MNISIRFSQVLAFATVAAAAAFAFSLPIAANAQVAPTTNAATSVSASDATLNGTNGTSVASDSSFWVSTSTFSTPADGTPIPADVYSTPLLHGQAASALFSASLSSVTGLPAVTPSTTYYYAAWTAVDGTSGTTWSPGAVESFTTLSAPTITSISPASGSTAGGTAITITGTDFNSSATVKVGGVAATNVVIVNSTTITATTPAGTAGAQNVVVTNSDTGTITAAGFTYVAPAPCSTGVGSPLLFNVTEQITNDPDSSNAPSGADWATDTITRQIQIWRDASNPTYYCAQANDTGTFTTFGGSLGISPQSGNALPEVVTGSIVGSIGPVATTVVPTDAGHWGSAHPIDCGNSDTCSTIGVWMQNYFGTTFASYDWSWTYNGGANGTWTNSSSSLTSGPGDIVHVPSSAVYVATGGSDSNDGSSGHPFATIKAAVDAVATGGTVNVAAGTYTSFSVSGKSNITITGAGAGSTIIQPTNLVDTHTAHKYTADMQASVFVNNSSNVTLENMTVKDNGNAPSNGGPDALIFWNASSGNISNVDVAATYPINGVQSGQGIAVDAGSGQTTNLTVTDANISGTQKNGVDEEDGNCNGSTCSGTGTINLDVEGGTITGAGPTSAIAQNGIVVWNEGGGTVTAKVNGATISGFDYTGAGATAAGILAYGDGKVTSVHNSIFGSNPQYNVSTNNDAAPAVDATENYWGSASGPATSTLDTNVTYSPWWTTASMTTLAYTTSTSTATTTVTTGSATTTQSTMTSSGTTTVEIAPNTTITGDASWDGTFDAASDISVSSVSVTPDSGDTATVVSAIEIGSPTQSLTLSNAARIEFAGQAGKLVGWTVNGTFTPITATCADDTQTTNDTNLAARGDCKISDDGSGNLIVWTKHFTTFETYTEVTTPVTTTTTTGGGGNGAPVGGGGGGGGMTAVALPNNGGAPGGTTGTVTTTTTGGQVLGASTFNFSSDLTIGSTGDAVTALQQLLISQGYSIPLLTSGGVSYGYFGAQTQAAVAAYQRANGITPAVGYVGPITRALLNKGTTPSMSAEQRSLLLQQLQSELTSLLQQIQALMAAQGR